jgi:homopolymeric O-antigen transport system ATP-binding protein
MNPVIRVENLSKRYRIGSRRTGEYQTLREVLVGAAAAPWRRAKTLAGRGGQRDRSEEFWALEGVSLEINQGEVIGIVGRNGAGKSTLLKILSRITEPTSGRAEINGRVGCLLEVGTGFHPELTGRENIYLNGSILGMTHREIARRFDEIVDFAELETFLDTPVKRYSSGMYVRLAFAVAASLDPEILLVDEVLAVGDQAFQKKCLGKMGDVARSGRTVLLVSHNMATILNLCEKIVLLERGRLAFMGPSDEGISRYMESGNVEGESRCDLSGHPNRRPGMRPCFRSIQIRDEGGSLTNRIGCGEPVKFELDVCAGDAVADYNVHIGVEDHFGMRFFTLATNLSASGPLSLGGPRRVVCHLDHLALAPGRYSLSVYLGPTYKPLIDAIDPAMWLEVEERDFYGNGRLPHSTEGRVLVDSRWTVAKEAIPRGPGS